MFDYSLCLLWLSTLFNNVAEERKTVDITQPALFLMIRFYRLFRG